jgi:sulfur-oxidizing protein SoxA
MRAAAHALTMALALALLAAAAAAAEGIAPEDKHSGTFFATRETQATQEDDRSNPAFLWVAQGEALWSAPAGPDGRSCASCHGDAGETMRGVAARYPAVDAGSGRLLDLEGRILQCRAERQHAEPWRWESDELLGITAYVATQSRGLPISVAIEGPARPFFEAGRAAFFQRRGQLNLACSNCHDDNWGKQLRGDLLSQGQPTGYPIYRLEWQRMGSLQRRLRSCASGVRAELPAYGAPESAALELYLAWRAAGLPVETPAVRR